MNDDSDTPAGKRGPAYPFISLAKAMERVEQIHKASLTKHEVNPISFYKTWGYTKESGNSRQTLAALNHFGLVEYVGRGKDRKVKLSRLALRIILDKIPNSPDRQKALQEAALAPSAYGLLWERFGGQDVATHAMETFLTLDKEFSEDAASKVIEGYRATLSYAGLPDSDNLPDVEPDELPEGDVQEVRFAPHPGGGQEKEGLMQTQVNPAAPAMGAPLPQATATEIKVMLDGAFLRVSAVVDAQGAKKLMKALKANIALLDDDDAEDQDQDDAFG